MKNTRIVSMLLALGILSSLAACGDDSSDDHRDGTDASAAVTSGADGEVGLSVPKANLDETITYLAMEPYVSHFNLITDNIKGDVLSEAGYKRALAVSEHLGVRFEKHEVYGGDVVSTLNNAIMGGEGAYDFVVPHYAAGVPQLVSNGLLMDLNELEYVDFTKPWWNATMQEALSIGGKTFFASGDITMTWQGFGCILFNKAYLEKYNIDEDLYQLVRDGKWTADKMLTLIKGVSDDLDGNTVMDENDQYGFLMTNGTAFSWQVSWGQPATKLDEDGCPTLAMGTEKMVDIVEKYHELVVSSDTYMEKYGSSSYATSIYRTMLLSGQCMFVEFDVGTMHSWLREIEYDFGVLPLPKWDEDQENYNVACAAGIIGVPADADPKVVGMVAETLAYYSYEYIRPAFFDVVLQNKAVRDEDSFEMLELIQNSKRFDFAYNFVGDAVGMLDKVVVTDGSTDFMSHYDSVKQGVNKTMRDIFDEVAELD